MRGVLLRITLFVHRVTFSEGCCLHTYSLQPWSVSGHRMRVKERFSSAHWQHRLAQTILSFLHFKVLWMRDDINCCCSLLYLLQHSFNTMYE
ncbi:hypothetical protein CDAR_58281 [Caerostris darwini]|uniref:Secreted protein n=1 Tax=Caerostris darwini TaxID=1538125 RepID=A0AAV4U743_9ARAC|nr:hypothetical protein CDAR_58281 [Caerostris darwini]